MKLDSDIVDSIVNKTSEQNLPPGKARYLQSIPQLLELLDDSEVDTINKLMEVNPADYGVEYDHVGILDMPDDLVTIEGQVKTLEDGINEEIGPRYLPPIPFKAYEQLNDQYFEESGKRLFIIGALRGAGFVVANFLYWYQRYNYDLVSTIKSVATPGYTEHGDPLHPAVDFVTQEGIGIPDDPPFKKFDETAEFEWLNKHAHKFGFYLSYPINNRQNVKYEPWHWRYLGK